MRMYSLQQQRSGGGGSSNLLSSCCTHVVPSYSSRVTGKFSISGASNALTMNRGCKGHSEGQRRPAALTPAQLLAPLPRTGLPATPRAVPACGPHL